MKHRLKCKVCGAKFAARAENRYTAIKSSAEGGIAAVLSAGPPERFDAFDCPECGSQHLAQIILPRENTDTEPAIIEAAELLDD